MKCTVHHAHTLQALALEELTGTTVVLSIPAAFSDTCTNVCVPSITAIQQQLLDAGVDQIVIVASDPVFAVQRWAADNNWSDSGLLFASDYGTNELARVIGTWQDETRDMPASLLHLLRRACLVCRDGEIIWQHVEDDSGTHTLDTVELLKQVSR